MNYKIIRIPTRRVNVYLLIADGKGMLVDIAAKKNLPIVYEVINRNGLELSNIKSILLTHTHYDHVDVLKEIRKKTGQRYWFTKMKRIHSAGVILRSHPASVLSERP